MSKILCVGHVLLSLKSTRLEICDLYFITKGMFICPRIVLNAIRENFRDTSLCHLIIISLPFVYFCFFFPLCSFILFCFSSVFSCYINKDSQELCPPPPPLPENAGYLCSFGRSPSPEPPPPPPPISRKRYTPSPGIGCHWQLHKIFPRRHQKYPIS